MCVDIWHHSEDVKVCVCGSSLVWNWPKKPDLFKYHLGYESISKLESFENHRLEL